MRWPLLPLPTLRLLPTSLLILAVGCDIPPRPPMTPAAADRGDSNGSAGPTDSHSPPQVTAEPREAWSLYVHEGRPIGYRHVVIERGSSERQALRYQVDDRLLIRRGEATLIQQRRQRFAENPRGRLEQYDAELRTGPALTVVHGEARDTELSLEFTSGYQKSQRRVAWGDNHRGPLAVEQSLLETPLEPGDTRTLSMLQGSGLRGIEVRLQCVGEAVVPTLDRSGTPLREINLTEIVDGNVVRESVVWTDRDGAIQRRLVPELAAVAYQASAEIVAEQLPELLRVGSRDPASESDQNARSDQAEGDPPPFAEVAVRGTLPDSAASELTLFEVGPSSAADVSNRPLKITPAASQWVKQVDDHTWQVLINRLNQRAVKGFSGDESPFTEADLTASRTIDLRSRAIQDLAKRTGPTITLSDEEWAQLAEEMTKLTHRLTTLEPPGRGIITASEVAKRASGDAIGQAILLTAMLRSKKIPARVAFGLRYQERASSAPVMQFHAWTVAWYGNHWHPFDATLGAAAPADRITLAVLDLADGSESDPHQRLLEVLQRLGDFKIRVLKARPVSSK